MKKLFCIHSLDEARKIDFLIAQNSFKRTLAHVYMDQEKLDILWKFK